MKSILVTGASSGIGRALAVRAARAGYAVYAVGRNMKALAALAAQVSEEGGLIKTDVTDVSDPANAPGLVGRTIAAFGQLDVLVNNAGAVAIGPIAMQSDQDLRAQFGTHVIGPLAIVREALPSLRATGGHVFMLGSGVARVPVGGLGAYPPSKAALRSATTILRREVEPLGIAVTYVDPGAVDTAFMRRAGMPGAPEGVLVSPELVARKILFAIGTRPRVLNVAPLQSAAVAVAEMLPGVTELVLARNPSLIGSGPPAMLQLDGRTEKLALPPSLPLPGGSDDAVVEDVVVREDDDVELGPPLDDEDADRRESLGEAPLTTPAAEAPAGAAANGEPPVADHPTDAIPLAVASTASAPRRESVPADDPFAAEPGMPIGNAPSRTATSETAESGEPAAAAPPMRWAYEPPDAAEPAPERALSTADGLAPDTSAPNGVSAAAPADDLYPEHDEPASATHDIEPARATTSFDAALEPLANRMQRARFTTAFVRELLVPEAVLDVNEIALRWAGMPNKHERALTSEVFFALSEWGFLAPRADGRYRVIRSADDADV